MNNKIYNDKFRELSIYVGELRKFAVHTYLEVEKIKTKIEEVSNNDKDTAISRSDLKEIVADLNKYNKKELDEIMQSDKTQNFRFDIDDL